MGIKILDIFEDVILNSTALYEYKPRTLEDMISWFRAKQEGSFPVIGLEGLLQRGIHLGKSIAALSPAIIDAGGCIL